MEIHLEFRRFQPLGVLQKGSLYCRDLGNKLESACLAARHLGQREGHHLNGQDLDNWSHGLRDGGQTEYFVFGTAPNKSRSAAGGKDVFY